jgi:nicotinate phosphoribosyltransferase
MDRLAATRPALADGVLLTDLYELTMLQAYHAHGMNATAAFELFVRALPPARNFLLAAGLEQVLAYLEGLRFGEEELEWLAGCGRFRRAFVDSLADLRFTGEVDAMPEGTAFFADEPILRVVAPLREAQLIESRVMNLVHFQTLVASKAARSVLAAPRKVLVDFGLRRAHGAEAALLSARAAWIAGFTGTATVEAERRFGIPAYGTMAHSYVQAHDSEEHAFERFALSHPGNAWLLIDTYDTERAAHLVAAMAPGLARRGATIRGVRIDSGDLGAHARAVRAILDEGGQRGIAIFASGNLDEHRVAALEAAGAPIDGYGIGTRMNTSADAPFLDCAYKLQEYAGLPRRKRSEGKATWPGRKQVFRRYDRAGRIRADTIALVEERVRGEPLLRPVMRGGERLEPSPGLAEAREHAARSLATLPAPLRALDPATPLAPEVSPGMRSLAGRLDALA